MTDPNSEVAAIIAGTQRLLRRSQERARLLDGLLKAINQHDAVLALIYTSESAAAARPLLMDLLRIDEFQARAVLDVQARRLAGAERRALADEYQRVTSDITEYERILGSPARQRELVGTEQGEFLASFAEPDQGD
jgi:DNA gyrase subunit A